MDLEKRKKKGEARSACCLCHVARVTVCEIAFVLLIFSISHGPANWSKCFVNFEVKGPVQALCDADQGFRCIFYFCFFSDTY